ncbi:reverse transcriptase domain-containing protein [Tanacetum coccineum]
MIEADYELAQRLQAEEQGELTIGERSRLFVELMDKRKKHFAKLKAEKIRRKPPTKAQKRNQMSTYLRNMAGYKHTQLKNKSFEEIQMLFNKEMKRVNSFVHMDLEVVEGSGKKSKSSRKETVSKKKAGKELDKESVNRQKLEDDAEKAELQLCLKIVPREMGGLLGIKGFLTVNTTGSSYMLVEIKYPLTQEMLSRMLSRRLEVDHECEMAYELLRFTRSQLKKGGLLGIKGFLTVTTTGSKKRDDKSSYNLGRPYSRTTHCAIIQGDESKKLDLGVGDDRITFLIDKAMRNSHSNDDTCFRMDVIEEVIEEELDVLLDDSKPFSTTSKKISESSLDNEFKEFMAMKIEKIPEQEEEVKNSFKKKILFFYISALPQDGEKKRLVSVFKEHKEAFAWKTSNILGISPSFCKHKINFEDDAKPVIQRQRRLNPNMKEFVKKAIIKLLDSGIIYAIKDSPWVSPVPCKPKKGGMTVVTNEKNELVPTRIVNGWRVCNDYRKLNETTRKDHFPLPFMDQMLERLTGNKFFCFLNGFSGYFQIPIEPADQEKTTFTCPYGTYTYKRMPFGLCNAPATFQRCMIAIFQDMLETSIEVFMDDFSVFGDSFDSCLANLEQMLVRCK